jgi:hypothetical protein
MKNISLAIAFVLTVQSSAWAAWSVQIEAVVWRGPEVNVNLRYFDDSSPVREWRTPYTFRSDQFTETDLKRRIQNDLAQLAAADAAIVALQAKVGAATYDPTISLELPTQAELDKAEYAANLRKLDALQRLVDLKVIAADDKTVVDAQIAVKESLGKLP